MIRDDNKFEYVRKEVLNLCLKSIKDDGYAKVGHAMKGLADEDKLNLPLDKAFKKSVAFILQSGGEYIMDEDGDDFIVAKNPLYEFNKSVKRATERQVWIAVLTMLFIGITAMTALKQYRAERSKLLEENSILRLDNLKYHQMVDSLLSR